MFLSENCGRNFRLFYIQYFIIMWYQSAQFYLCMNFKSRRMLQGRNSSHRGCITWPNPDHSFLFKTGQWSYPHIQHSSRWHLFTFSISWVLPTWNIWPPRKLLAWIFFCSLFWADDCMYDINNSALPVYTVVLYSNGWQHQISNLDLLQFLQSLCFNYIFSCYQIKYIHNNVNFSTRNYIQESPVQGQFTMHDILNAQAVIMP